MFGREKKKKKICFKEKCMFVSHILKRGRMMSSSISPVHALKDHNTIKPLQVISDNFITACKHHVTMSAF